MKKADLKNLQQKVTLLRAEGKYKETIEAGYELLTLGKEWNDYKSILVAHINNAASFYSIGAIEEAFQSMEAYEEICTQYGDDADRLSLYNVLFLLYDYNKDPLKSKETLSKTIALGKKLNIYNILSNAYSNLSHVLIAEENYAEALKLGLKGLEMAKLHKPESRILEIRVMLNIALAYIGIGDLEAAKQLIEEIMNDPTMESESFIREKSQSYILLGNWYAKQDLYREAVNSYTEAKELVESYHDVYLLKTIQEERSNMCEVLKDIELGYEVQKEYIALLNEINDRELALAALKLEVKHSLASMEKKVNTDHLTGLYNRRYLENTTNEWLKQSSKDGKIIGCIVFDIDNFKTINDTYGHLFGDEAIKLVCNACLEIVKENEVLGRYGGDEFVLVIKDSTIEGLERKATSIQQAIKNIELVRDGDIVHLNTSLGVADNSSRKFESFEELFHVADKGLYEAKRNGKNQFKVMK